MQKQNKQANERSEASEWAQRSERMSPAERTNERSRAREQSDQCVASEWVSDASERTSERTSKWPSTLRVDFVSFQPRARRYETFFVSMVEEILFFTT